MASTVNSTPTGNNASGNAVHTSQNSNGRTSLRPSASTRVPDNRRQSPVDGGARRSNSQKAWTGANPITQRYSQQNGNMSFQKQSTSPKPSKESNTSDNHAHDRLLFLVTSFIGLTAVITTKNGEKFTGIFSSSTLEASESSFVLKMVRSDQPKQNGANNTASPFLGLAPDHTMVFDTKDVVDISVANVSPADVTSKPSNGASANFRTDTDISGNQLVRERPLQRWEPSADEVDMSLETSTDTTGWDQFETNERLFGARSNYDETFYTTRIDRSDPTYKQKEAQAARIAREIEGTDVDNAHVKEERGLTVPGDAGEDEEAKYSGVRRDEKNFPPLVSGQPNKYTPPARRQAGTQQPSSTTGPSSSLKQPVPPAASVLPQSKEPASSEPQSTAAATPATDEAQKTASDKTAATTTTTPKRAGPDNATANVETEVLDHFRQFANSEKLKMQERRRNQVSYDRNIKLNELMKFSKNFKLATPVPKDLVPILAKDPDKQEAIITRAQHQTDDDKPDNDTPPSTEEKPATRGPVPGRYESGTMPASTHGERSNVNRSRQLFPPTGPQAGGQGGRFQNQATQPGRPGTGMLSHRLADNLQQRKGNAAMGTVPTPLPIPDGRTPPTGPAGERSGVSSPNKSQAIGSSKFNVKAMEFKPNPAASSFTPGGGSAAVASPQPLFRGPSVSRAASPSVFFGSKKPRPVSERPSLNDQFNPIKRMKKEGTEPTDKASSFNGGIPPAYRTLPTWDTPAGNEDKTYLQMFKPPVAVPGVFPQQRSASNSQVPHQPQMPFPFQQATPGMPPVSGPPHGPHLHPQQHHSGPPNFDDHHRMQMSSSTSQIFPSPRLQQNHVAYPSPMTHHAQLAFQQPMPQFYVNQGGPQPPHMRHYPGAPQFMNPQGMAAPMMVQQPSGGPYMGVPPYGPQMQMYSPNPSHVYPQHGPPPQSHSGFPSPSRGAPMMMHQNSQPGQPPQPVMFMGPGQPGQPGHPGQPGQPMYPAQQAGHVPPVRGNYPQQQPHFQSSPHQAPHYPPHQHRAPSNGYNQVPQMAPQLPQPPPAAAPGPHPPENAADEAK